MPTSYSDVAHLLRRTGFGPRPDEINALTSLDLAQVVDRVLDTSSAPSVTAPTPLFDTSLAAWDRYVSFLQWQFDRMATTPSPIVEKLVMFWHNHFTSSAEKTDYRNMWDQFQVFRSLGLGSFTELCKAVAVTPAMIEYLDNSTNVSSRPNENFARELMELFTLGIGNYTQDDIVASARAWSGHNITSDRRSYVFNATKHDNGNKTFFGITKNWNGPDIIDEICTGQKQMVTARFITTKLWEYFAHPSPDAAVVDALATQFAASNMNIKALLRAMFLRPEFYSDAARQGHVRSPVELVVAGMRYTGLDAPAVHPEWWIDPMGQKLLYPPNVAGWKINAGWVGTTSMWARANFARNITWLSSKTPFLAGTSKLTVQTAVQRAFDAFCIDRPSPATRSAIEKAITAERQAKGWGEQVNLTTLTILSPDFQVC